MPQTLNVDIDYITKYVGTVNIKAEGEPLPDTYHHGNLRQELLNRAIEQLSTGGIESLSLRALARDLGVSHAAPLRHFKTKADLLRALAGEGVRRMIDETVEHTTEYSGLERMMKMAVRYVEWAIDNPAYHQVLRNPDVMRHATSDLKERLEAFAAVQLQEIQTAQEEGWRPDENPEVLFFHLVALISGTAIVATDPIYEAPIGKDKERDRIVAALRLFLS